MAPHNTIELCDESAHNGIEPVISKDTHGLKQPPRQIKWLNVTLLSTLHLAALFGISCLPSAHPLTWLWGKCSLFILSAYM